MAYPTVSNFVAKLAVSDQRTHPEAMNCPWKTSPFEAQTGLFAEENSSSSALLNALVERHSKTFRKQHNKDDAHLRLYGIDD
jgi:hypothetical protein